MSAKTLGGPVKILISSGPAAMFCVVIVAQLVAYPDATAVIVACPFVVVVLKVAMAYVWPSGIVIDELTVPTFVFEEKRSTCIPSLGALAGIPLESCNWTIIASYEFPSAGSIDGNPYTASAEGIGQMVVIDVWTVA